jgi:transposase-like protein
MNVYEVLPGYQRLAKLTDLSKDGQRRLKWFDYYCSHNMNARLTCRHFDISPQTVYRWKKVMCH